ncbi:MAG: calcium-binding protein [Alphaproteobacteria bacterium]
MALLPRLPKLNMGQQEISHTVNTALDTTEARNPWPFVFVPGLLNDAYLSGGNSLNKAVSYGLWPFASADHNIAALQGVVNHVLPTAPEVADNSFRFDYGERGNSFNLDVRSNDTGDDNVLNNLSPLLGPDETIREFDFSGLTFGSVTPNADGESFDFIFRDVFARDPFAEELTQSFTYTVTNLSGVSSTATVELTVYQYIIHAGEVLITHGTDAHETIIGTDGPNRVNAGGGRDILFGLAGEDVLNGGAGDDVLHGGDDNDRLGGEAGNDVLNGGHGDDDLRGGAGQDVLRGDSGGDDLFGQDGDDVLHGGTGDDVLYGGAGADILFGNAGNDRLYGEDGADVFVLRDGDGYNYIMDFNREEGDKLDTRGVTGFGTLEEVQALLGPDNTLGFFDGPVTTAEGIVIEFNPLFAGGSAFGSKDSAYFVYPPGMEGFAFTIDDFIF